MYQVDKDSLPVQKEALIAYAQHVLGIQSYEIFSDAGYSGKNTDRPAYQDMISRCRMHEFSHILVYKIDRISRNLLDFAAMYDELKKLHVIFISRNEQFDTSSAIGEAMLKIILVFAELERKMTSERVTGVMIARAKKGLWNGARMPLGYDWDKNTKLPVINQHEADIVQLMFTSYASGQGSSTIANYFNDQHVTTKHGGRWTSTTVRHILQNPMYKGTLRYNYRTAGRGSVKPEAEWIVLDDVLPAIVSKKIWDDVQNKFKKTPRSEHKQLHDHPLSGLIYCQCGSKCYARKDKARKSGLRPSVYYCISRMHHWGCTYTYQYGDVTLIPSLFTYIQNMLYIQDHQGTYNTPESMEPRLAAGMKIKRIANVDEIFNAFTRSHRVDYRPEPLQVIAPQNNDRDRERIERALSRLKELYLYGDEAITRDEYVAEKQKLVNKLKSAPRRAPEKDTTHLSITIKSKALGGILMSHEPITYARLLTAVDDRTVHDFLKAIIRRIDTSKNGISSITFANGIKHEFIY
jgi:DNA invertase Pin-like site-specific DNA recombinase